MKSKTCLTCGKTYRPGPNVGRRKFCSRACVRKPHASTEERFWSKVDRSGGAEACWPWRASVSASGYGYGNFMPYRGRMTHSHRFAWSLIHGEIPKGMCVCHACDNPPCCNPAHLFLGTHTDNMRDMFRKGRRTHKKPAYENVERGEERYNAVLTADDVLEIRRLAHSGMKPTEIARRIGVCTDKNIRSVVYRRTWNHIQAEPGVTVPAKQGRLLSDADVREIRACPRFPGVLPTLAERFGVKPTLINQVRSRKIYKHVT